MIGYRMADFFFYHPLILIPNLDVRSEAENAEQNL